MASRIRYDWSAVNSAGDVLPCTEVCCREHAMFLLKALLYTGSFARTELTEEPCQRCSLPEEAPRPSSEEVRADKIAERVDPDYPIDLPDLPSSPSSEEVTEP